MPEKIDFTVRRDTPSLDHYRREWTPGPGVALAGMWLAAVVTDASGQYYVGIRGADDMIPGMTHTVTPIVDFRALQRRLDADPPHLFDEYSTLDWFEPLQYADSGQQLQLSYDSGRIERDADGCHWYDASGRWEMHGKTVSDVFVVQVPAQQGVEDEVYYRHELVKATGTIGDVAVEGYVHQDYAYGPPGTTYSDLPIVRQLQGMWVSWLHEYSDGELGGGCFWQGRDGLRFGPGYQLKGGTTTVHDDISATPSFNEGGKIVGLDVSIGDDSYSFVFDMNGSPLHVFGRLVASSSGKEAARSWCWVEYAGGMLTPEILDLVMQKYDLARGR